jgi:nucleoside-diphosphate-sugar epimerase
MRAMAVDLVTGAFGYTGSRIAARLLRAGREVATLTRRRPGSLPLETRVTRLPYDFNRASLAKALTRTDTVYVTYWMRFPWGDSQWDEIVRNVDHLAHAAAEAGVRRLIYISVSNAHHGSPTPYFRAKARAEATVRAALAGSSTTYAIVRPTLLYGPDDILINNMAWTLRNLPLFGIPGDGHYRVQPVHVDDVADLCIRLAAGAEATEVFASGPEILDFNELVNIVRRAVRSRAVLVHMPVPMVLATTKVLGMLLRDVVLTRDEIHELMRSLLVSPEPASTPTKFTDWVATNGTQIGRRYSSELGRNYRLEIQNSVAS